MHSQPNGRGSRRPDKVCCRGRFPGSSSVQRPVRSVIKGQIANAGSAAGAKLQEISGGQVRLVPCRRRQSNED